MFQVIHQRCSRQYIRGVPGNTSEVFQAIHQRCPRQYIRGVPGNTSEVFQAIHQRCSRQYKWHQRSTGSTQHGIQITGDNPPPPPPYPTLSTYCCPSPFPHKDPKNCEYLVGQTYLAWLKELAQDMDRGLLLYGIQSGFRIIDSSCTIKPVEQCNHTSA